MKNVCLKQKKFLAEPFVSTWEMWLWYTDIMCCTGVSLFDSHERIGKSRFVVSVIHSFH